MFGGPEFAGERAHQEESKFRRRFGQDVGGIRERDFVLVGSGAVDIVKADSELCDHFERAFSGSEDLGVDRIAQRGDQTIYAGLHLFENQALRRSFGPRIDFHVVSLVAKNIEGVSYVTGGKNTDSLAHGARTVYRRARCARRKISLVNPVPSAVEKNSLPQRAQGSRREPCSCSLGSVFASTPGVVPRRVEQLMLIARDDGHRLPEPRR